MSTSSVTPGSEGPRFGVQALLDADRLAWKAIWERFAGQTRAPWREPLVQPPWAPDLPALTGKDMVVAARGFKRTTGLGVDSFNPRWLCHLSQGLLDGFAALLAAVERVGVWPTALRTLLISQIPKGDGGRRPIGLLPTLVRVWEKLRKPVMRSWKLTVFRAYNYADKGSSSQLAVWKQALQAEASAIAGGSAAALLVDLTKAFEMVRL